MQGRHKSCKTVRKILCKLCLLWGRVSKLNGHSSNDLLDGNSFGRRIFEDAVISTIVRDKEATLTVVKGDPNAFHTTLNNLPDGTSR